MKAGYDSFIKSVTNAIWKEGGTAIINLEEIKTAERRLKGVINRTRLDYSNTLSKISGNEVYLKPENLQKTGSFKIRGAVNHIFHIDKEKGRRGVITASSGNHGQAVAYAAALAGYPATVVVPENASSVKVAAARAYGAEIVYCGKVSTQRRSKALELAAEKGFSYIHGFDDPYVISGQGTIGLEILQDLTDADIVLVPVGGGGLISGIATAIKESKPKVKIIGVEPIMSNSMFLSLKAGRITELNTINTIADGLRSNKPGKLTFPTVQRYVDDIFLVTEEEIKTALITILERGKILAEPSGAVTVAAVLAGKIYYQHKKIVAVISGGNIELNMVAKLIASNCYII